MVRVAYTGANLVPIAVPFSCLKYVSLKQKILFLSISLIPSKMNSFVNLGFKVSGYFSSQ